jgi:hypothetical protein
MTASPKIQLIEPLRKWLDSLPRVVPLRAVSPGEPGSAASDEKQLEQWITDSRLPADSLVTAMLWLRIGVIDPPHDIVQSETTPLASYLHGVVHRLEGDYWNSKYWFRQVRDRQLLQSLSHSMEEKLKEANLFSFATSFKIMQGSSFVPAEFVSACEQQCQQAMPDSERVASLEHLGWSEWASLWELIYQE